MVQGHNSERSSRSPGTKGKGWTSPTAEAAVLGTASSQFKSGVRYHAPVAQ
mgnify:CR=1 FL=1